MKAQESEQIIGALSRLLPAERADEAHSYWRHGEPDLAVETLIDLLSDRHVPLTRADRARLLKLAISYGCEDRAWEALPWCPDADDPDWPWRAIEHTEFGRTVEAELVTEIGPGHPLHGKQLTAWLACERCDDVLLMVDEDSPDPLCAVVHPTWSRRRESLPWPETVLLADEDDAIAALGRCHAQ
ncbi:hypothetical protein GCM10010174_44920 [Kutzneria viridogrisea]|uniref:Uncharacterized protein n=2 Tax=Kutzneria TaxID=43356 RepID=W5WNS3_9PSEU|nr:MafI family immunity protein [Kutzneria albida]AHH99819.1 hypothetical protein KALB_6460 [Kutzneria albida DSM 43870]MBA8924995.1 hypothetical protein [Kutzneria viridogrisea]